jgi:hypothetical protein
VRKVFHNSKQYLFIDRSYESMPASSFSLQYNYIPYQ